MGRWGDGEMGRWGDGEMGRWGDREIGRWGKIVILSFTVTLGVGGFSPVMQALPPPEDIPEEILRTEIITEARSPIDGKLLSAAEYAELQASLQLDSPPSPTISREIRHLIFLLRIRSQIRLILPFL